MGLQETKITIFLLYKYFSSFRPGKETGFSFPVGKLALVVSLCCTSFLGQREDGHFRNVDHCRWRDPLPRTLRWLGARPRSSYWEGNGGGREEVNSDTSEPWERPFPSHFSVSDSPSSSLQDPLHCNSQVEGNRTHWSRSLRFQNAIMHYLYPLIRKYITNEFK